MQQVLYSYLPNVQMLRVWIFFTGGISQKSVQSMSMPYFNLKLKKKKKGNYSTVQKFEVSKIVRMFETDECFILLQENDN